MNELSSPSPFSPAPDPVAESDEQRRERALAIVQQLERWWPEVRIPLRHGSPLQLLMATILSAQCTDATVNRVSPLLWEAYPDAAALAGADRGRLEAIIHPTGFFRQKARMIQEAARLILARFGGEVPRTMDELLTLPGVGRKTANVLLSAAALEKWPGWEPERAGMGIVVDTHVLRLARRLGLSTSPDPAAVERDLMQIVPRDRWATLPLRLIYFGRRICVARRPHCDDCPLRPLCPSGPYGGASPWLSSRGRPSATPRRKRTARRSGPSR
ncbi:endonuclease III [Carboxydochorda subterranea]|uniref:Endonuclease III n=1 Tax=Carboxydichorda subterranea TaxID=3109565 RepID=A0ABZ1BXZ8_9FIRM|nr:endonuclease III [Limnochorda sp. L945t]WRP17657.1 endonuclease III [Limnochorda sp. L945t]